MTKAIEALKEIRAMIDCQFHADGSFKPIGKQYSKTLSNIATEALSEYETKPTYEVLEAMVEEYQKFYYDHRYAFLRFEDGRTEKVKLGEYVASTTKEIIDLKAELEKAYFHGIKRVHLAKKEGDKCNCGPWYHVTQCANWVMCD